MNFFSSSFFCLLFGLIAAPAGLRAAENYLENPDFEGGIDRWHVSSAAGSHEVKAAGPDGAAALTFTMKEEGDRWFMFFQETDLSVAQKYLVSFFARSEKPLGILVAPQRGEGDYGAIGGGSTAKLGPDWKEFHLSISIDAATSKARLTFLPLKPIPAGIIQFARFQLEAVE